MLRVGESDPLQSGHYVGSLTVSVRDTVPLDVRMRFEDTGKVSGEDSTGNRITGTHTKSATSTSFTVECNGIHFIGYKIQEGKLGGKWKSKSDPSSKGLFQLNLAVEYEDSVAALIAMGFAEELCRKAIVELKMTVEEAANCLSSGRGLPSEPVVRGGAPPPPAPVSSSVGDGGTGDIETNVQALVAMGFDGEAARIALQLNDNNVDRAVQALTDE
eukprot:PhF_6_TR11289/c0_g1_i1/m.18220